MDYQELIERLRYERAASSRDEAANAIESLLAENGRLKAELAKYRDAPVAAYIFKPNNELLWLHEVDQNVFASDQEDYDLLYIAPQPDRVAELEAALSKFKDALFDVLIQDMSRDKALAKINEVLKP